MMLLFWSIFIGYLAIGTLCAKLAYNDIFNDQVNDYKKKYLDRDYDEKEALALAIERIEKDPPFGWPTAVFIFWPVVLFLLLPVCAIGMGIEHLFTHTFKPKSYKLLEEMKRKENQQIELEKAVKVLKDAGINTEGITIE
jgi:hypothetical protein